MPKNAPSAVVTAQGERVLFRLQGRHYELSQQELRSLLGLPAGPPGVGISIEGNLLRFEFPVDHQTVDLSATQLHSRLAKQMTPGT